MRDVAERYFYLSDLYNMRRDSDKKWQSVKTLQNDSARFFDGVHNRQHLKQQSPESVI